MTEELHDKTPWLLTKYDDELKGRLSSMDVIPLFACESGSRAWGFASKDSDYDVRFVYRRPKEWYLNLEPFNQVNSDDADTIQIPLIDNLGMKVDAVGWDIRKFLTLVGKGNATPVEWGLTCPTYWVSREWGVVLPILSKYLDSAKMALHYRGLATKHWYRYMEGMDYVTYKKYLYILRGLWSVEWYLVHDKPASIRFETLMAHSNAHTIVKQEVFELLNRKRGGDELGIARSNIILNQYIADVVSVYARQAPDRARPWPGWGMLNDTFHYLLNQADGGGYEQPE